jgi:hypothetical protein
VPFGLNLDSVQTNGVTTITDITLITSHQSKADFESIKNGLSKRLGNPDIEDYEGGTDEIEADSMGGVHGTGTSSMPLYAALMVIKVDLLSFSI